MNDFQCANDFWLVSPSHLLLMKCTTWRLIGTDMILATAEKWFCFLVISQRVKRVKISDHYAVGDHSKTQPIIWPFRGFCAMPQYWLLERCIRNSQMVVVVVVAMNIIKVALLQYMLQDHRTNVTIKTVCGSQYTSAVNDERTDRAQ